MDRRNRCHLERSSSFYASAIIHKKSTVHVGRAFMIKRWWKSRDSLISRLKEVVKGRHGSAALSTLAQKLVGYGCSESISDDIMKVVELSTRDDGTKRFTVVQEGDVLAWRKTLTREQGTQQEEEERGHAKCPS